MAIYTKNGDSGNTSLIGGREISKADPLLEVLGTLDELNAHIGILVAGISFSKDAEAFLQDIQRDLFTLGSVVADPSSNSNSEWLGTRVGSMESYIDELTLELPELTNFILPGGSVGASKLHLARAVCRRLERHCVAANLDKEIVKYFNRMSDFLFTLARFVNHSDGIEETVWRKHPM